MEDTLIRKGGGGALERGGIHQGNDVLLNLSGGGGTDGTAAKDGSVEEGGYDNSRIKGGP